MKNQPNPPKKGVPMCCVSIGYQELLLPAADGVKLLPLLGSAVACESTFRRENFERQYKVREPLEVKYIAVNADQVVMFAGGGRQAPTPDFDEPLRLK